MGADICTCATIQVNRYNRTHSLCTSEYSLLIRKKWNPTAVNVLKNYLVRLNALCFIFVLSVPYTRFACIICSKWLTIAIRSNYVYSIPPPPHRDSELLTELQSATQGCIRNLLIRMLVHHNMCKVFVLWSAQPGGIVITHAEELRSLYGHRTRGATRKVFFLYAAPNTFHIKFKVN